MFKLFSKKKVEMDNTPKTVFTVSRRDMDGIVVIYGKFGEKSMGGTIGNVALDGPEVEEKKEIIRNHLEKGIPFAELI